MLLAEGAPPVLEMDHEAVVAVAGGGDIGQRRRGRRGRRWSGRGRRRGDGGPRHWSIGDGGPLQDVYGRKEKKIRLGGDDLGISHPAVRNLIDLFLRNMLIDK